MSALPLKAEIAAAQTNVRFVPKADILHSGKNVAIRSPRQRAAAPMSAHPSPSALAALRLSTNWNFEARSKGRSHKRRGKKSGRGTIEMTTSTHRYYGYELVLQRKSDDRYQVTIFDPRGKRTALTGVHLERHGALVEASQYINQIPAKRRASLLID